MCSQFESAAGACVYSHPKKYFHLVITLPIKFYFHSFVLLCSFVLLNHYFINLFYIFSLQNDVLLF